MALKSSKLKTLWLVLILGTVSATGPLSIDLYLPALPQMASELNAPASLIQMSLSACLIGMALGQIVIGPLSDKYGRKLPLIIGFAFFGIISLLITYSTSVYLLIGLRFFQGVAGSSGQVVSRAVARDLFSGNQLTKFYSMLSAVNGIFPVISPVIGALIIRYVDWKGVFFVLAIIGLIVTLCLIIGLKETLPKDKRIAGNLIKSLGQMVQLLKDASFTRLILIAGLISGALFSYISASSFVFQDYFHLSITHFSFLYAVNGSSLALGAILPGKLANHYPAHKQLQMVLLTNLMVACGLLASYFLFNNLQLVIVLVVIIMFLLGMLLTLMTAIVMNSNDHNIGGTSALIGLSQNAMGSFTSPIIGILGAAAYSSMAALIIGCLLISWLLLKRALK